MKSNADRGRLSSKHIVLLGIGHTNAHIVRMWGMKPIPDTDLTCITDFPVATYSGMLPAVLAGQVPREQMQIDLVRLCASVGARLICGKVTGVDHHRNEVLVDDRPAIAFDALSIGIGSVPTTDGISINGDSLIKIKPMQTFLQRLGEKVDRAVKRIQGRPLRISIVGSGAAGVEILFCLPGFLTKHTDGEVKLRIVTRSDQVMPGAAAGVRKKVIAVMQDRGIDISLGQRVVAVDDSGITLADQSKMDADLVIWATGASAPDALDRFGLPTDERGFLSTDHTLRSTSGKPCFAVGDSGTIVGESLPKAGVYAVRQGPVLWENLQRIVQGRSLTKYRPQQSFLKLLNCGDRTAIGEWKGFAFSGRSALWLKHSIDTKFMRMFDVDSSMGDGAGDGEMQCKGCGCKLGADPLAEAIAMISGGDETIPLEDAAIVGEDSGGMLLASTDFFTTPFDDAYLSGRVAALHSASDVIASGGLPNHALANVVLAEGNQETQKRVLADFLSGARREFAAMGAQIVGGHTIVGPRMEAGFTVIGWTDGVMMRKGKLQPGDLLCLTKPLGVGVLLAAHMRSLCFADEYFGAVDAMLCPQHGYVPIAQQHQISAMTDVTGFGLAGHLIEMLRESDVAAKMKLQDIPLLRGTERLLDAGIESTLAPDNRRFERWMVADESLRATASYQALFDPQTCGGLLFGIRPQDFDRFGEDLSGAGLARPVCVATICDSGKPTLMITS